MTEGQVSQPRASAPISRRRMMAQAATALAVPLILTGRDTAGAGGWPLFTWRGTALGAPGRISARLPDSARARAVFTHCLNELARLERIFSLYDPGTELSRLNAAGRLERPSLDLRVVLEESQRLGGLTGGAFDVTVQPLWRLYAAHFAVPGSDPTGPPPGAIDALRRLVDYRAIELSAAAVRFVRPGMAVTLNGIAQGYIDDRLYDILRNEGVERALIDLGETRGRTGAGARWPVGLRATSHAAGPADRIMLGEGAVATSSGPAMPFDALGRHHHLFDPGTGRSASPHLAVSVLSPRAALSDALATALALLPEERAPAILAAAGATRALIVGHDGGARWIHPA